MKKIVIVAMLSVLLSAGAWSQSSHSKAAGKSSNDEIGKMLIAKEMEGDKAAKAGDYKIAGDMIADDGVSTSPTGETNREGWVANMKQVKWGGISNMKAHVYSPNVAVITGEFQGSSTGKDGKEETYKLSWVDTWMKRNGQWKIIATSGELMR